MKRPNNDANYKEQTMCKRDDGTLVTSARYGQALTESQWLTSTDPRRLLACVGREASVRKLRLFACACCRRLWHLLTDERSRRAVEVAEQFADQLATREDLDQAEHAASAARPDPYNKGPGDPSYAIKAAQWCATANAWDAARFSMQYAAQAIGTIRAADQRCIWKYDCGGWDGAEQAAFTTEIVHQSEILRDIFGNPFRQVADETVHRVR